MAMKEQDAYADAIAAFKARGGAVTKVDTGARAIANDKDIYAAMRTGGKVAADAEREAAAAENTWHAQNDAAAEARHNGRHVTGTEGNGVTVSNHKGGSTRY